MPAILLFDSVQYSWLVYSVILVTKVYHFENTFVGNLFTDGKA